MTSLLKHRVERGATDMRKLGDLALGEAGLVGAAGCLGDGGARLAQFGPGGFPALSEGGEFGAESFLGSGHGPSVKHLTYAGKRRKVLYMETTQTTPHEAPASERSAIMASEFVILTPARDVLTRTYSGTAAEQFAAFVAEFPIGSGYSLRYTRTLSPVEPLVIFG